MGIREVTAVIGLLVFNVLLVSSHPYSPYTDRNGEPKASTGDWNDEAVAAYLRHKMKEEDLQPSVLSEYIFTLMQGGKKPPPTGATPDVTNTTTDKKTGPCLDGGSTSSLQREQLELILDTVFPATGNPTPLAITVTPDHGSTMYIDELDALAAYQVMLGAMGETSNIWTNYSPCPTCVRALLNHYDKPEDEKPTIHVARIYRESHSMTHILQSLQCLAKLIYKGFSVVPWNFNDFKAPEGVAVFNDNCTSDINSYYGYSNFTSAYMELESQVTFVQQIATQASSWCTV